jgi:hypothetical protein
MQSPKTLLFAGPDGAPVPVSAANPLPVTLTGGGAASRIVFVTFPVSAVASGTSGQMAYSAGFLAVCVATNVWVFLPTSGDYPL